MDYSIWILEYAKCPTQPVGSVFAMKFNAGVMNLPFTYIVIKSGDAISMIDVGYDYDEVHKDVVDRFEVVSWQPPEKVLAKIGVKPADVKNVFLTHSHYDHMGNLHGFPNAHFYLQKDEMTEWTFVMSLPPRYEWLRIPLVKNDMVEAMKLIADGRMTLVEGHRKNVIPNVELIPVPNSHTFSCQLVLIRNDSDTSGIPWIIAGDCAYSYENLTGSTTNGVMHPVGIFVGSPLNILKSFDTMKDLANGDLNRIIIGHDDECWTRYPSWVTEDGLHVAEVCLEKTEPSRRPSGQAR